MAASASTSPGAFVSSSSSSHPNWTYDVYLSFRGRDTRAGFVDHLCQALLDAGINTFRDEGLPIGEVFSSRLFSAMKGSRFVIVVFSRNYAASTWCLEELAKMMECQAVTGQRVLPIFYHVDPSDVRNQGGSFAEAFLAHEERYSLDKDKAHRWRAALRDVCNVLGRHVAEDTRESLVVREIVAEILKCTNQTMSSAAVFPQQALFNLEPPPSRIPIPSARSPTNISPTGRIRPVTTRCEKRKLLGHGSRASVNEEITACANERVKPSSRKGSTTSYLQARSPDLGNRTSIRIEGVEVQLARMNQQLEFSGPKNFETSMSVWQARKVRPSSDIPRRLRSLGMCSPIREETKDTEESEAVADLSERTVDGMRTGDETELPQADLAESSGCCRTVGFSGGEGGNGIKGVSPPKPPPARRLPVTDNGCSNRDLSDDLALDNERGHLIIGCVSSSDEEEKDKEAKVGEEEEEENKQATGKREVLEGEENVVRHGDIAALSESRSFTTSNDDDSSGTTPGLTNISPNGRTKPDTTCWEKGNLLGRGSFGSVHEGIAANGVFFAIKEVSLLDQGSKGKLSIYQLEQEITLLSKFEHENIVQYYGTEKDESNLYIFLELVTQGSLLKVYQKFHLLDPQVSGYTRQILYGLKYLHDRNVVHRDIKCANILVDANGFVKLADFGLAKATKLNDLLSCKGTAFWMAPEVVNGKNQGYGLPADIWSLGCTVLEMLTREIPYSGLEGVAALFRIGKGERPPIPDSLSKDARDFVLQCLQAKAPDRPTAAQLLDHPFVRR